jgi:putative membrane protein
MGFVELILGIVIAALISGFVIWVVGKLGLGLEVTGFAPAFIAAIVIGLFGFTIGGGFLGAIISLITAAVVLMISGRIVPGLKVNGFMGAIVAAIAIGVVAWLVNWVLGLFNLA